MKPLLIKLLTGRAGRIKSAIAAMIIGGVASLTAKLGFEIPQEWTAAVTVIAVTAAGWILESIAAKLGTDGVKAMQDELQAVNPFLKKDGDAGRVTMGTLEDLLAEAGYRRLPEQPATVIVPTYPNTQAGG